MSIFPGNVLVIDDQFNIGYQPDEPEDLSQKTQWNNFRRLRSLFDNNGFCYSVITDTRDINDIIKKLKIYQNIRLLILDLDLDESGEVEETDVRMVKDIIMASLDIFGYYFLAINSSYSDQWETIKNELLEDLNGDPVANQRKIHFLNNFCIALDKTNAETEESILKLLSDKFSHELITQFEAGLNSARDKALSPFLDFTSSTWEQLYKILREDMDSKEHVNLTLNNFLFGLLKQQMIGVNYSVPPEPQVAADETLQKSIVKSFNYLSNVNKELDQHPIWTGNIYYSQNAAEAEKYLLVITPECDIAQSKAGGFTVVSGFEMDFPTDYKPENYKDKEPPLMVRFAGKKSNGDWKPKSEIDGLYKGLGYYILMHSGLDDKHLIFDLRSAFRKTEFPPDQCKLILRVNEPVITDITDKYSAIYNRKGIPRLVPKNYTKL